MNVFLSSNQILLCFNLCPLPFSCHCAPQVPSSIPYLWGSLKTVKASLHSLPFWRLNKPVHHAPSPLAAWWCSGGLLRVCWCLVQKEAWSTVMFSCVSRLHRPSLKRCSVSWWLLTTSRGFLLPSCSTSHLFCWDSTWSSSLSHSSDLLSHLWIASPLCCHVPSTPPNWGPSIHLHPYIYLGAFHSIVQAVNQDSGQYGPRTDH